MRLLMEAVMVIAIVSGMVFMSKMGSNEPVAKRTYGDEEIEDSDDDKLS